MRDFKGISWCCRTGLNCRPLPYQGSALPLSYGSRARFARGPNCHSGVGGSSVGHGFPRPVGAVVWSMTDGKPTGGKAAPTTRKERLAAALRANLRRRKAASAPTTASNRENRPENSGSSRKD